MVRVLAITHIVVGALLIIFGIADRVTAVHDHDSTFKAGYVFYGLWIGTWVSILCRSNFRLREAVNIFLAFVAVLFSRVSKCSLFTVTNESVGKLRPTLRATIFALIS